MTECGNHRGITLLSHVSKTYERVLDRKLRECTEDTLGNWQYGYRPGRSTNDLTFAMRMLLEKSWEWNMDKFIAFVDLEKAFQDRSRLTLGSDE